MLHIIGVSHNVQSHDPRLKKTEGQKAFADLLRRTIDEFLPVFVGEEDCEENLNKLDRISIVKEVADAAHIEHRFLDPDQADRESMGYVSGMDIFQLFTVRYADSLSTDEARLKGYAIERGVYFPVRERYWLDGLDGCREHSAIFVCGYGHLIDSFLGLLDREGVAHKVVQPDVGVTEAERKDVLQTVEYLREHPHLRSWKHKGISRPTFIRR